MSERNRKCLKCGSSWSDNPKVSLHRFPKPGVRNIKRCEVWAKFCFPEGYHWATKAFQEKLYSEHRMLCSRHFPWSSFIDFDKKRLHRHAVPENECTMLETIPEVIGPMAGSSKQVVVNITDNSQPVTVRSPSAKTVSMTDKMAITEKEILHGVPLTTNGQNSQIESSINVDTGEEEILETEEIVYDDGYRCSSPEVVEKEILKVLPVLCVKCRQLIETHLYVCASCSDSQYEPLCATCAEHAALDAHAACYVLRARVTRPKTEIRGVLCAIRSELAMKSFADDLEDAITDIKSETADIPEDTDVLDVDPFDEIDSAVAVSAEGDPNASLTTSEIEETDYNSYVADLTVQDLLDSEPELDVTKENECHKSPHPTTCLPSPKTENVVQRRDEPQLASTLKPLRTPIGINIIMNDAQPKLQAFPAPKETIASVTVQSDDTKSAVTTGLKRLRDDIDSYAKVKKVKLNNPQQVRTKLITVKKGVNILRKDLQIEKLNTMKEPDVQMVPRAVQNVKCPIMPKGVKEIVSESTDLTCSDELTMETQL